ncbi:MAG: transcriptional regulator [Candidatus Cloacimonadota bacterium]|nr:MAG: transcriptional regulator [Candidatus Cloacimonadota bacterium]PIE78118.1 MAG: transcriptional regulator [Candidatus Delongbacteria bacterium]
MSEFDYKQLDDLLCSRIRLAIISVLVSVEKVDFKQLKIQTKATDGNLSANLKKLEEAGYITIKKSFVGRKPHTTYFISNRGKEAFKLYVKKLESMLK